MAIPTAYKNSATLNSITAHDTVVWLRRDLRITDNAALYYALRENENVIVLFIFDSVILEQLEEKRDARVQFIYDTLMKLKSQLEEVGSSLAVLYGDPVKLYKQIHAHAVYTNEDYEPYARTRESALTKIFDANGIAFKQFKDQAIFSKNEILKDDGTPYTIYTPYSKKWKAALKPFFMKRYPSEKKLGRLKSMKPLPFPKLSAIGFERTTMELPPAVIKQTIVAHYDQTRDYPAIRGTTHLGMHLRFGTVSIRQLVQIAKKKNQVWLNELIWREFFQMILWHFPKVQTHSFKSAYDRIKWRNNYDEFEAWCEGRTGYPLVDAGMRELNTTGFMHNRVRMVTASFLTKHLLIDWRWGEAYFAKKLLDYDLAANNGNWQWAAGCGCDAAPYFRVFNPSAQMNRFDKHLEYVKRWVPETGTPDYPQPIVDHVEARERVLKAYKTALNS